MHQDDDGRLPPAPTPLGDYLPAVRHHDVVFVSGQTPRDHTGPLVVGKVGADVDVDGARAAARLAARNCLAVIEAELGSLDAVGRVLRVVGYVASAPGFTQQPGVIDAASALFVEVLGDRGRHARSAIGVAELPHGVPVELEVTLSVRTTQV